ncbi:hypothetical protein KO493_11535 [Tamlana agarivorans]|uniref:Uncharacterized protein n=1 Tax=Pseudotamlana agarivorans TaxID=481183 RepID=A0ACC5UAJ1_9FLAO|nr:hypothetical protein [Tamlana agarivorans]MBU2951329.1 hypothetical protein [Tamlana agarivorans]
MIRYIYFFLFSISLFSQEVEISTQFFQEGTLYKELDSSLNRLTRPIGQFSESETCMVVDFLGRDNYKVKYKDQVGIVKVDDLEVNEEMMDLYYAHQNKERLKLIQAEDARKEKIYKTVNKEALEKQKQDSLARIIAHQKELAEALRIKKANEAYQAKQKALEGKRIKDSVDLKRLKDKVLEEKRSNDSISKNEFKQKEIEANKINKLTEADFDFQKELYKKQIKDSIIRSMAIQRALYKKRIKDSILKSINSSDDKMSSLSDPVENSAVLKEKERLKLERIKYKDSCSFVINDFDTFYNVQTIRTEAYVLSGDLTVELYRQGRKINVFFNSDEDLGCVSYFSHNRSSVKVTLESGRKIAFYHSWDMECGRFSFKGNLSKSQMSALKASPVQSITLKGTKGRFEITNVDYNNFFMDKLKCIE